MKNLLFCILFLPFVSAGQITSSAVSDSIQAGIFDRVADTSIINAVEKTIQVLETFWYNGDVYVNIGNISGSQFKGISATADPNVFKYDDTSLVKAWHIYEIGTWLEGYALNYSGYSFAGIGTITCTLTIDGDPFYGDGSNNTDALGMAFYHFLIDPTFSSHLN